MPAQRPRASFEPIPPDFDLKQFVEATPNFSYVDRISYEMIEQQGLDAFEKLILLHVILGGKPLVVDGFEDRLDPWTFTPKWLRDNCGDKVESARNIGTKEDLKLTMAHYLNNMGLLTNQFFDKPGSWREKNRQRMYLKDIDCPTVWWDKLKDHIPAALTYLNDSVGEPGGPGAVPESMRLGKGIAKAGDLMSSLPPDMRAENLMCYIGHEGTYTPAHKEMCASLGQNIMVEASNTVSDEGKAEKPGSSIWFMTESKDRHLVSEYWLSVLGHDIEVENHFAQIVAWKKAPFNVYVVEQRPGDFILIPPLAPHQVWNRGTRTIKVAWNRTTVETLEMAINEALPRAKIVGREEQYKNKAIIYYTLQKYASLLTQALGQASRMPTYDGQQFLYTGRIKQLQKDFKRLFALYKQILLAEMFNPEERDSPKALEYVPFDSNVTCAYCRGNIFNRFLSCPCCKDLLGHTAGDDGDPYDVCMDCYAMGRSCACMSGLKWVEQFRWKELASKYENWRRLILQLGGTHEKTPLPLIEEHKRYGKKSLADVCKEQLKRRPFKDIKKPVTEPDDDDSDDEVLVGDDGMVKKIVKKKSKSYLKNNQPCHVCCHRHPTWKMAKCTTCERSWCYGSLFRGWDKMPLEIMEDKDWSCPHCLNICFAGACRREAKMQPYEPQGTLLGYDTKKIADVRSVEALVDFSVSNLNWLKDDDPANRTESKRLRRARAEADRNKQLDLGHEGNEDDDRDVNETQVEMEYLDDTVIDPALTKTGEIDEEDLARQLQQANSSLSSSQPVGVATAGPSSQPDGYAPLVSAGYSGYAAPPASMYPNPDDGGYHYPGQSRDDENGEASDGGLRPFRKRSRSKAGAGEDDEFEDISMQKGRKQKKPRLAAAGFRSYDLAGSAEGPMASKAKNEVQRQFEKEKERKALEKAKSEGRFIMLQAALKGKKRIVKLAFPASRLGQLLAQQTAKTDADADAEHEIDDRMSNNANGDEDVIDTYTQDLLVSDIAPKKTRDAQRRDYEQRVRDGHIVSGATKKALVPVEKDENYGYTYRQRLPNGKRVAVTTHPTTAAAKRRHRQSQRMYEEVNIGSESDDEDNENDDVADSGFVAINGTSTSKNRRSLPNYLQGRHADDHDTLEKLPDGWKDRSHRQSQKQSTAATAEDQLQQETIASASKSARPTPQKRAFSKTAGKRPSMRPAAADSITIDDDDNDDDEMDDDGPSQAQAQAQARAAQRIMEEDNRLAKLQALEMLKDQSGMEKFGTASRAGKFVSPTELDDLFGSDPDEQIPAR